MKKIIIGLIASSSISAFAETYDCGSRGSIRVKTSFFSNKIKQVDGIKVNLFGQYVSAEDKYSWEKRIFEKYYDRELIESVYAEDYRVIGDRRQKAYSRGFFELSDKAYIIWIFKPSPWCVWDACSTHYEIISCDKIR
jgi:hypothetical protein